MSSDSLAPESVPRHKAYVYVFLICLTAFLICIYSYPLYSENRHYVRQLQEMSSKFLFLKRDNISSNSDYVTEKMKNHSVLLHKLFANLSDFVSPDKRINTTVLKSHKTSPPSLKSDDLPELLDVTFTAKTETEMDYTKYNEASTERTKDRDETTTTARNGGFNTDSSENEPFTETTMNSVNTEEILRSTIINRKEISGEISAEQSTIAQNGNQKIQTISQEYGSLSSAQVKNLKQVKMETTHDVPTSVKITHEKSEGNTGVKEENSTSITKDGTSVMSSSVQKGFLVFSQQCKIPDLDPMHPSIRHLIEINPPLNCSKDYKPLSKTEGHFLILDELGLRERAGGLPFSCCYKSVFRINDGLSDNGVGFGKECIQISSKTIVEDEFITVECTHSNGTLLYKEFHSFIFDKPKVEKRCSKSPKNQYSVLIVGVDAVSRMNMHRQLNATVNYLLKEMDAVEMYGYNKVGDNTFPNLVPLLLGYDERELPDVCWNSSRLPLDRCNFLWKRYAEKGYRTFYAEDEPHISTFNYVKEGFLHQPTDYYFRPFIKAYEDALAREKPLNCYYCVGSTSVTEATLTWVQQFAAHFSDRPYFAFTWINSLTHDFLNMGSSGDHMYEKVFRTLHQSGALNKTIVIFLSDHGMRWGAIRKTYIGRLEERLPMLLIALPREFQQQYPRFSDALKKNSHRLVTPFDLHATLVNMLNLTNGWTLENIDKVDNDLSKNYTSRALSLFQPIPDDRSCDDAFIEEHWCTCELSLEADIKSDDVKQVASFLLNNVNNLLKPVSNKCAVLTMNSISDAHLWQPEAEHTGHSADDKIYTVIIQTNPGNAIFEGTVKLSQPNNEGTLLGTISRLNLYGNQSSCMDNAIFRKYCYCL